MWLFVPRGWPLRQGRWTICASVHISFLCKKPTPGFAFPPRDAERAACPLVWRAIWKLHRADNEITAVFSYLHGECWFISRHATLATRTIFHFRERRSRYRQIWRGRASALWRWCWFNDSIDHRDPSRYWKPLSFPLLASPSSSRRSQPIDIHPPTSASFLIICCYVWYICLYVCICGVSSGWWTIYRYRYVRADNSIEIIGRSFPIPHPDLAAVINCWYNKKAGRLYDY